MKVGIVGRTGSGKSTIAQTLSRLLELEGGNIKIDNVDIRKVGLKHLRQKVTMIPQDPSLFKGTLRYNIDPESKCTDEEIQKVIDCAELSELLKKHNPENLLEFELSEGGENLSSGEK